jgi:sulfate transport system substrate-binding protein
MRSAPVGAQSTDDKVVQRGIGDVLLAWENEAFLAMDEPGNDKFEIVVPSSSILAEPTVSVVDKVVNRHGTAAVAQAYLQYLYSPEGQQIAARHFVHPRLNTLGGWQKAQKKHFDDGGIFDRIYRGR